jgi:hypothetical protein
MNSRNSENNNRALPDDVSIDRVIAEIMERAQRISDEQGDGDCMPFHNWLKAEKEIREKYGLPKRNPADQGEEANARDNP